jgi:tripartite-type tricarboxylate transporter receptor subunit TctC
MVAVLSGDGDAVISSISEQSEYIKGGRLRSLGMVEMSAFEFAGVGAIPGIGERFPDIGKMPARQWLGFAVPGDTPKAVTDRLDAAFVKAMKDEDLKNTAGRLYLNLFGAYGDEAMKILSAMESAVSWKLQELGVSKVPPESLGIPKP